jgi:polynucleotide 5'-hydroxyl-kinase GRC3/NOL9
MSLQEYPEWSEIIPNLIESGGTILLLGGTDAGKTTFCTLLVNAALAAGRTVSVIDSDIGQSEIGPPSCVGLGSPREPIRSLSDVVPASLVFVGATTPRESLLEHAAAVRFLADTARKEAPGLLIVDTTGYIRGSGARRLKQAKIELLAPDHIVAIQRKTECEPILASVRFNTRIHIHRLPIPKVITIKQPVLRAQRRAFKFARYFDGAEIRHYDFDKVSLLGTWMNGGAPMPPHHLQFLTNSLRTRVFYAELVERHLGMVTQALPADDTGLSVVQEQFRPQEITVTPSSRLRHLLVGLSDGNGKLLGLGLIEAIDLRRRQIGVLTPIRAYVAVKVIQFGLLRLKPDGSEVGTNKPGDV